MYGLPEDFDGEVFAGRELIQVSFSKNTVSFWFGDDLSVTLESTFIHKRAADKAECRQEIPVTESSVMSLIGKEVSSVKKDGDGTLILHFENGDSLAFLDDAKQYESYSIRTADKEIVV